LNVSYRIAKRYLSGKKRKTVVNWVTRISMIGIAVTSAALVILIAAFNGIENMVEKLYSEFDTDITIRATHSKTFNEDFFPFHKLKTTNTIQAFSKVVEEVVILKHENKWVNARMLGVDSNYLDIIKVDQHHIDGDLKLKEGTTELSIFGATLLDKLNGAIFEGAPRESIIVHAPKRNMKMRLGSNPFSTNTIEVAGRVNYNREVNSQYMIVSLDYGRSILKYGNDLSLLAVDVKEGMDLEDAKEELQSLLGEDFSVKTSYEKNSLIFQTSKSEKMIVITILVFVFILASFNLIASLTLLFIEKKQDIETMASFGANRSFIQRIFVYEGLLICIRGALFGAFLGIVVCCIQMYGQYLTLPNSAGEAFPISFGFSDFLLVFAIVSILSFSASYFPVRFLISKHYAKSYNGCGGTEI
jgi:lipoprotein-releasing system permease protein